MPLLVDRIDLHVEILPVDISRLTEHEESETSQQIRARVIEARNIQLERFKNEKSIHCNAQMTSRQLHTYTQLDSECTSKLKTAIVKLNLSARAYDRILKVARTIADLDHSENIRPQHISEAINYRNLDREGWAG